MPSIKQRIFAARPTATVLYHAVGLYAGCFRLTVKNERPWMARVRSGKAVVLCCWHQQFFSAIRCFRKYRPYKPALMISRSMDGELIAGVAKRTGWDIVRGSSSKGGRSALDIMVSKLRDRKVAGHIADGPQGPAGIVKAGCIRLAQRANAVIVPFYVTADRAWFFNSWDRFMLPAPFARVTIRFGSEFRVADAQTPEAFEQLRRDLEDVMRRGMVTP